MLAVRITETTKAISDLSGLLEEDIKKKAEQEENLKCLSNELAKHVRDIDRLKKSRQKCLHQEAQLYIKTSELRNSKINILQGRLEENNQEQEKYEDEFRSLAGEEIVSGCISIWKVFESLKAKGQDYSKGYHGLVLENIKTASENEIAVEITAGKWLYYGIVETEEHGAEILNEFKSLMLPGEINLMALDSVGSGSGCGPSPVLELTNHDAVEEMVNVIEYDAKFTKVIQHIFGKTLICQRLDDEAVQSARSQGYDCVTLDGYKVASSGVRSGVCASRSCLKIQKIRTVLQHEEGILDQEMSELMETLRPIERKRTEIWVTLQENERALGIIMGEFNEVETDVGLAWKNIAPIKNSIAVKQQSIQELKSNLDKLQSAKAFIEQEFSPELRNSLFNLDDVKVDAGPQEEKISQLSFPTIPTSQIKKEAWSERIMMEVTNMTLSSTLPIGSNEFEIDLKSFDTLLHV